ncbi:hypothetical protein U9M48_026588 [Paspalum notatum var. saurae]|uniref:Uncharacterized protein n=1 Tax=Paspalum notatum var. saurae TaxID=547442 RepID=A0AAQ3WZ54_PASNO
MVSMAEEKLADENEDARDTPWKEKDVLPVHRLPTDPLEDTGDEEKGLGQLMNLPATQPEEMNNPAESTTTTEGGDTERSVPPSQPIQNGTNGTANKIKERKHFDLKASMILITLSMVPLTDILFLHRPTANLNMILKISAFFAFTAFISSICLMIHTLKLMAIKPEQFIPKSQLRASQILFTSAVGCFIVTCILIAYSLLPKAYYFLPLSTIPSLLVGGFHFLHGDNAEIISPAQSKALKKELKRATQLTLSLLSASFSGFIGVLLAIYHKADSLGGAAYSHANVAVYLLLGAGSAGIFALLLCRLLPSSNNNDSHRRWGSGTWQRAILATANIVMLAMLASAVLTIAETILHGLLAGAAFPVVVGATGWLLVEFCTVPDEGFAEMGDDNKADSGTLYAIGVAVASLSFGAILAIFAGVLGGTVTKEKLKVCTFFLASAFVAAVSLGAVAASGGAAAKKKASTWFAATVLACCSLGALVLAALALFYQIAA